MDRIIFIIMCFMVTNSGTTDGTNCGFETNLCGWTSENFGRSNNSGYSVAGPKKAFEGDWFIISDDTSKESILKITIKTSTDDSCLKFRYHMYGSTGLHLEYGYNIGGANRMIGSLDKNEDYWDCATFRFSSIQPSPFEIYFKGSKDANSISIGFVALDNLLLASGTQCSTQTCAEATTTPTKPSTSSLVITTSETTDTDSNDTVYIAGGAGGAVFLLIVCIAAFCVVTRKFKRLGTSGQIVSGEPVPTIAETLQQVQTSRPHFRDPSQATRPLPNIPLDDYVEISETDLKQSFSTNPIQNTPSQIHNGYVASSNNTEQQQAFMANGGTYVHVPPDYPDNEEEIKIHENFADVKFDPCYKNTTDSYLTPASFLRPSKIEENQAGDQRTSEALSDNSDIPFNKKYENVNDDYLCPVRAADNQYESDPTEKNVLPDDRQCAAPSDINLRLSEIPFLPAPVPTDIGTSQSEGEDYDDAKPATQIDQSSDESDREVKDKTETSEGSDCENYLTVEDNDTEDDNYLNPQNDL